MKKLKLMADYQSYPLWLTVPDGVANINPDTLPISEELKAEIGAWTTDYDETLNISNPAASGFGSEAEKRLFIARGERLANDLAGELSGHYSVVYVPAP